MPVHYSSVNTFCVLFLIVLQLAEDAGLASHFKSIEAP